MRNEAASAPELARAALAGSQTVLLVDWHEDVPRSLVGAGYEVLSTHEGWFRHEVTDEPPPDALQVFPPTEPHHKGYLVTRPLKTPPTQVDMVCTYRPEPEQLAFVNDLAIPLGAKWFWVERGDARFNHPESVILGASDEARAACAAAGVGIIEGLSLPVVLAGLAKNRSQER